MPLVINVIYYKLKQYFIPLILFNIILNCLVLHESVPIMRTHKLFFTMLHIVLSFYCYLYIQTTSCVHPAKGDGDL